MLPVWQGKYLRPQDAMQFSNKLLTGSWEFHYGMTVALNRVFRVNRHKPKHDSNQPSLLPTYGNKLVFLIPILYKPKHDGNKPILNTFS